MMKSKDITQKNFSDSGFKTDKDSSKNKRKKQKISSVHDDVSHSHAEKEFLKVSTNSDGPVMKKNTEAIAKLKNEIISDDWGKVNKKKEKLVSSESSSSVPSSTETKKEKKLDSSQLISSVPSMTKTKKKRKLESSESTSSVPSSAETKKKRKLDSSESASLKPEKKKSKIDAPKTGDKKSKVLSKKKSFKIKQKLKKKKAKKMQRKVTKVEDSSVSAQSLSLDYLKQWKNDVENWSFQKVRQVWLLKNMYSEEMIYQEDFSILLEYLAGLQGAARKVTIEQAEKIMKDVDTINSTDNTEAETKSTSFSEEQVNRVQQVLQLLY